MFTIMSTFFSGVMLRPDRQRHTHLLEREALLGSGC